MDEETVEQMMSRAWEEGAEAINRIETFDGTRPKNPYAPVVVMVERFKHGIKCGIWDCRCGLGDEWKDTYEEGVLAERARTTAELVRFRESLDLSAADIAWYKLDAINECIEILDNTIAKEPSE
jgi:hypothetical protein